MALSLDQEKEVLGYVQGQMDEQERRQFEAKLNEDTALQDALKEYKWMHGQLADLVPSVDNDAIDEELIDRVLASFEEEEASSSRKSAIRFPRMIASVAAVAALLLCMFLLSQMFVGVGTIKWLPPEYGRSPGVRGQQTPVLASSYDVSELEAYADKFLTVLTSEFSSRYEDSRSGLDRLRSVWNVRMKFQPLLDGAIEIELEAIHARELSSSRLWSRTYTSKEEFVENGDSLAVEVAVALSLLSTEPNPPSE